MSRRLVSTTIYTTEKVDYMKNCFLKNVIRYYGIPSTTIYDHNTIRTSEIRKAQSKVVMIKYQGQQPAYYKLMLK